MDKLSGYLRSDRTGGGSGGSSRSRFLRYSGSRTSSALDRVTAPSAPEMSYTARKYSASSAYSTGRRSGSREKDSIGRSRDVDRVSLSSGRGGSTDRLSSGYCSRRGSSGSDLPSSPPPPPPPPQTKTSYTSSTGRESARYSRSSSAANVGGSMRRATDSPDTSTARSSPVTPFISGYSTMERRNSRRKKEYERRSSDRGTDTSLSYASLERRSKYGRTYSCDLPSCRTTPTKDYTKELYKYTSNTPATSTKTNYTTNNSSSSNSINSNSSNSSSYTTCSSSTNGKTNGTDTDGKQTWLCEGPGGRAEVERERSPSLRAIHEGLARINHALQRHKEPPGTLTNGSPSSVPPPPPPPPRTQRDTPEARNMRVALAARGRNAKGARIRVNNFAPLTEELNVQKQINLKPDIVIPAEARLAQRRAARAEARELRLRELEKQQHEQDNDEDKPPSTSSTPQPYTGTAQRGDDDDDGDDDDYDEDEEEGTGEDCGVARAGSGRMSGVSRVAGVNSVAGGQYSRRSSEDSTTDEALPANVREMRADLKELDEKFRKAMITNAQLDNEKATLTFEVELMKDRYTELEETHTQLTKEHRKKCTEYEQLRKVSTKLQEEVKILRGLLQERDQLIQEYGLVVVGEEETEENGEPVVSAADQEEDDVEDLSPRKILVKKALVSQEAADLLSKGSARGSLDVRLKKFGEEKNDLEDQVRRLKLELEEERCSSRRRENGLDYEKQKEQSKTVNEYKFRVQKAEAEVSTLQANVARLDALSTRYKTQSDELERSEEELKLEKRKLQRELRDAQSRLEELETTNNHLIKRFDKLKNARSNLLKDLSQDPA